MGDVKINFNDDKLNVNVDTDQDNKNSIELMVNLPEAFEEVFKRGDVIEGQKYVTIKMEGTTLSIEVDSDRDGEKIASLKVDAFEAFDEGSQMLTKDEETKPVQ